MPLFTNTSENGFDWNFKSILAENNGRYGTIWECPDFFELDGKHALICSPMNMTKTPDKYNPGNGTLCLIGTFDRENTKLIEESDQPIDGGVDFYAPTTLLAPDGRRIMIAWMQNWESIVSGAKEFAWYGQMTIPRELHIKDNHLIQNPVREIESYWRNEMVYRDVTISDKTTLYGISGRMIDMTVNVRADRADAYNLFEIHVASDDEVYTSVRYKRKDHFVTVDRRYSGIRNAVISQRSMKVRDRGGDLKLRIIIDRYSVEVFVNDGEQALSTVIYTDLSAEAISFMSDGKAIIDVDKYDIVKDL